LSTTSELDIYEGTQIKSQWERIIIISKLPSDMSISSIKSTLANIIKSNRGELKQIFIPADPEFSTNKDQILSLFQSIKAEDKKHQDRITELEKKIKDLIETEENKKNEIKHKKEIKAEQDPVQNVVEPIAEEEDKKEKEVEEDKKEQDEQQIQENKTEKIEEDKVENLEQSKEEEEKDKIDLEEYNHQGAAVIVLEEFNLAILHEEDLIDDEEGQEEEVEKEEEVPAEFNVYNCGACTLENPMSNDTCAICGTPRPADAGQSQNKDDGNGNKSKVDLMAQIEEKYAKVITNRIKGMVHDFHDIVIELNKKDQQELDKKIKEVENLKKKFEDLKNQYAKVPKKEEAKESAPENIKEKVCLKGVEEMNLENLFRDDNEEEKEVNPENFKELLMEEQLILDVNNQLQPKPEEIKVEEIKQEEIKEEPKQEEIKEEPKPEEIKKKGKFFIMSY
jgi:hypothetical protein